MSTKEGMNYAPKGKPNKVCSEGDFIFSVAALDHGHIFGMTNGLLEAGATLKYVYDKDEAKIDNFIQKYPQAIKADSLDTLLNDEETMLIAAAAITNERGPLGVKAMESGKHYFTDKAPFTTLAQLESAKEAVNATGKRYMVYYSERLHNESSIFAGELIKQGAIGKVVQVLGLGPHRLSAKSRPEWFFVKEQYGGILCDIGSHQIEQFLYFTGAKDATVVRSQVANYANASYPELEDFGEAMLVADNGASGYFRVDWFTPDGLSTWGDGRMVITGTEGYIELRKYVDIATDKGMDNVYLVNGETEQHFNVSGKVGYPFFGEMILDLLNGTENAMTQEHAFKAAELCLIAQRDAAVIDCKI